LLEGYSRQWAAHGDPIPGVHLSRFPIADHDDAARLGTFTRPACHDEAADAPLRPLEHPVVVVAHGVPEDGEAQLLGRASQRGSLAKEPAEDFHRALDRKLAQRWRRA
jgi:hypothetical protein